MNKKALGMFLLGTSLLFCSCVDDTYDLKKEIDTDVEIKGNKLAFPLGTLRPFMLDSLVKDVDIIETIEDGVYCIKKSEFVQAEKYIEPIIVNIPSQSITKEIGVSSSFAVGINTAHRITLPSIPFSIEEELSFKNKVPNQFKRFYTCIFKENLLVKLHLRMDGLETLQASSANLDFSIDFPAFIDGLTSDDACVKITGNRVHVTKEYLTANSKGIDIDLYCSGFDFEKDESLGVKGLEPTEEADGNTYMSHNYKMAIEGEIQINNANPTASEQNARVQMEFELSFGTISIQMVNGVFKDGFYETESTIALDLGDKFRKFITGENEIRLSDPRIELELHNTATIPFENIEFKISGKDKEGKTIDETLIEESVEEIEPARIDHATGEIIASTYHLLLVANKEQVSIGDGVELIEAPNLVNWLECTPDSMYYYVHPIIAGKRADIRIGYTEKFSATYDAMVPFKFDKLSLVHCDTIPATLDLDEETISNLGLTLKMNVANTVPLDIEIVITALDEEKKPINDIHIAEPIKIEACNNELIASFHDVDKTHKVEIKIEGEDFSRLAHLKFDLKIKSQEGENITLRNTHGIQISDVALVITGDIVTETEE